MRRLVFILTAILVVIAGCDLFSTKAPGILEGRVTIGPICPIERPDVPCPVPPEAYMAREIWVFIDNQRTAIAKLDGAGNYSISLRPGVYVIDINHSGIDSSGDVPKEIMIVSHKRVRLDISIDTGIR